MRHIVFKHIAYIIMLVQIAIGISWMINNFYNIPEFGDTAEYIELSKDLIVDEYRPILYPYILNYVSSILKGTDIELQCFMYSFQTIISFLAYFYFACVVDRIFRADKTPVIRWFLRIFVALFFTTIPMITYMNFSILTDSLANSALIFVISGLIRVLSWRKCVWPHHYLLIILGLFTGALLRGERLYIYLILGVVSILYLLIRYKKEAIVRFICLTVIFSSLFPTIRYINDVTQTPGAHDRVTTNFEFVLLDRIVWPNMKENYPYFPMEIKKYISIKDAEEFDKNNNNVMYITAPKIEKKIGKRRAYSMYRELADIVLENNGQKIAEQIGEDILAMLGTPFSSLLNMYNMCEKNDGYNIYRMSSVTPELTKNYSLYYLISFLTLLLSSVINILISLIKKAKTEIKSANKYLFPLAAVSLLLTLWFCIGDGAPPNDRYALIIYTAWSAYLLVILGVFKTSEKELKKIKKPLDESI